VTSQLLVPFLANIIRREEKRVIKRFNLYLAMSTDASLLVDLGASPVSPVRASETTNVMRAARADPRAPASSAGSASTCCTWTRCFAPGWGPARPPTRCRLGQSRAGRRTRRIAEALRLGEAGEGELRAQPRAAPRTNKLYLDLSSQ
jgi:hypothetical protein